MQLGNATGSSITKKQLSLITFDNAYYIKHKTYRLDNT